MTAGVVHLTFVPNEYEAEILCALLRTEGLTCDQRSTNLSVGRMDGMPGLRRSWRRLAAIDSFSRPPLREPTGFLLVAKNNGVLP
jgi:ABC-type amino acid transport substrate-binding protein